MEFKALKLFFLSNHNYKSVSLIPLGYTLHGSAREGLTIGLDYVSEKVNGSAQCEKAVVKLWRYLKVEKCTFIFKRKEK